MIRGPSNDASLVSSGPRLGTSRERREVRRSNLGRAPLTTTGAGRAHWTIATRLLLRVVLAIVTAVLGAALSGSGLASATLLVSVIDGEGSDRGVDAAPSPGHSHVRQHDHVRADADLKAVESDDDDDDDDVLCHVLDEGPLALRNVPPPRSPERARRGHDATDPSRFAGGASLPRGPPRLT